MDAPALAAFVHSGEICDALDLSGKDYSGADLGGGLFHKCNFAGSRFDSARVKEAVFVECNLTGASLLVLSPEPNERQSQADQRAAHGPLRSRASRR